MTRLKPFRAAAVITAMLTVASVVASAPAAASPSTAATTTAGTSNSLPAAPTGLRQIGIDSYGYPILTWSWGSPDESGTYTVRYQGPAPSCRWPGWDSSRPARTW